MTQSLPSVWCIHLFLFLGKLNTVKKAVTRRKDECVIDKAASTPSQESIGEPALVAALRF